MNKLEANISLFIITFFASIQYIFLASIPSSVSTFAFLAVTNLIGFLIALALFWSELFRLDRKQILQSVILSAELVVMNVFLLLGSSGMRESVISCVVCVYFVFIPPLSMIFLKEKYDRFALLGTAVALAGVLLITNQGIAGLWNVHGHRQGPDQGPYPAGQGPRPGLHGSERSLVRVQQRRPLHHRL